MTQTTRRPWRSVVTLFPVTLASALVCGPGPSARADDKSDLLYKIEGKLKEAASQLGYLANDSGDRPIDYARGYVDEARRYASELKNVAGDDSNARNVAEYFERYYDAWDDASNDYLRPLKGGVGKAEPTTNACKARDRELSEKAEQYRRDNNPDGLTELPRLADTAKDATRRELDELRSHDGRQADYASRAQYFSADGPWRDLDAAVDGAARDTLAKWRTNLEAAKTACERVERGVEHPVVKEVIAVLSSSAGGRKAIIEQLNRDARDLGATLAGVSEDSGTGSIQRAKALVASIKSGLLESIKKEQARLSRLQNPIATGAATTIRSSSSPSNTASIATRPSGAAMAAWCRRAPPSSRSSRAARTPSRTASSPMAAGVRSTSSSRSQRTAKQRA